MARLKRDLKGNVKASELTFTLPQCKLIRDFLRHHDLPGEALHMFLALSHVQLCELGARMRALYDGIQAERVRLRKEYDVLHEDELPHERRVFFDAALRTYIAREDHYP